MIWKLSRLSKESEKDFFKNFKMMMMMMTIDKERKWQTTCNLSGRENDDNDDCPLAIKKRKCLRLSWCSKWQNFKIEKTKKEMKWKMWQFVKRHKNHFLSMMTFNWYWKDKVENIMLSIVMIVIDFLILIFLFFLNKI